MSMNEFQSRVDSSGVDCSHENITMVNFEINSPRTLNSIVKLPANLLRTFETIRSLKS